MLWAQLRAALFMTVPKKLCPLADGSLAEAAADHHGGGGGGGDGCAGEDIGSELGQFRRTSGNSVKPVTRQKQTDSQECLPKIAHFICGKHTQGTGGPERQ